MEQGSIGKASPTLTRAQLWCSIGVYPRCRHRPVYDGRMTCAIERQEWHEANGHWRTEKGTGYFFSSALCPETLTCTV